MKTIVVAGGTGLIGSSFIEAYKDDYKFIIVTRSLKTASKIFPTLELVEWKDKVKLRQDITSADIVFNFVGENIGAQRWTKNQKQTILTSRTHATQTLTDLMLQYNPTARLFNASAIGIYGLQQQLNKQRQHVYDETSALPDVGKDFLSEVGLAWEQPLNVAENHGLRIVRLRFGVVLAKKGGMLKKLLLPFKFGMGGKIGSGQQPLSWVAIEDVVQIIQHLIQLKDFTGVINLVAPEVVSQTSFATTLAKLLHRPLLCPMPTFVVKSLFGEMGQELLLSGQSVVSKTLPAQDYTFKYPNLEDALKQQLSKN